MHQSFLNIGFLTTSVQEAINIQTKKYLNKYNKKHWLKECAIF